MLLDHGTPVWILPVTCPEYDRIHADVRSGDYLLLETFDTTVRVWVYS